MSILAYFLGYLMGILSLIVVGAFLHAGYVELCKISKDW